jgi:hypothetical protein
MAKERFRAQQRAYWPAAGVYHLATCLRSRARAIQGTDDQHRGVDHFDAQRQDVVRRTTAFEGFKLDSRLLQNSPTLLFHHIDAIGQGQ